MLSLPLLLYLLSFSPIVLNSESRVAHIQKLSDLTKSLLLLQLSLMNQFHKPIKLNDILKFNEMLQFTCACFCRSLLPSSGGV
jgi:hypothetical protein